VEYVDILLTGDHPGGLLETNVYPKRHFVTKDIERPKYFLRIEIAQYALDLLEET